jgi:hypothetical protein
MEHMLKTIERPELNKVWDKFSAQRLKKLRAAQKKELNGAWRIMTDDERACYRFMRAALEHIEQANEAFSDGWMPMPAWKKWEARITAWKTSPYWEFVAPDAVEYLSEDFRKRLRLG